ncbi:alpha-(1,3)-fucosyltransferase 10 isoform X2 [Homalodisca vitripennis]|uniref:alpha-(1,3)-fucosyltransferase 10 isoform X2 n=1 Tax=Homalodisca vitripennis TaxID=197043 RepID=UPI001EECE9E9|nr:alpha-(1,3)-fucosyltransferase 10 isoform X2 [Homalodisca vitripennis]
MRLSCLFVTIAIAILILLISQLLLEIFLQDDSWQVPYFQNQNNNFFKEVKWPVVLWWAPLSGIANYGTVKQCGQLSCFFTDDRRFQHHPLIKLTDLPLPRNGSSVLWALLHEESPRNNAPLSHPALLSLFNFTATFSRHSSFPITTQYLKSLQILSDLKYFVPTEEKSRLQREEGLAPVIYLQTDCSTTNNRDSYVAELAKYINVDSYGECLHNKDLPLHLRPPYHLDTMMADELMDLVAKYKFMLAIENGVCYDYITEKLWRPLIAGSVPVYIGSPTVSDWLPNNKSAVLGLYFKSPKDLAQYLHRLNNNDDEYNSYLSHKLTSEVTNSLLIQTMEEREWDVEWSERGGFVEHFACFICKKAHGPRSVAIATGEHYSCPVPESILSRAPNRSNYWLNSWFYGACEAQVARQFVDSGVANFTHQEYKDALLQQVIQGKCVYPM